MKTILVCLLVCWAVCAGDYYDKQRNQGGYYYNNGSNCDLGLMDSAKAQAMLDKAVDKALNGQGLYSQTSKPVSSGLYFEKIEGRSSTDFHSGGIRLDDWLKMYPEPSVIVSATQADLDKQNSLRAEVGMPLLKDVSELALVIEETKKKLAESDKT